MRICRKIILVIAIIFCIVIMCNTTVSAEQYDIISDVASQSGADTLYENTDENVSDFFDEKGISVDNPKSIMNISIQDIFNEIKDEALNNIRMPVKLFSSLMAVIILSSLTGNLADTLKSGASAKVFDMVCVMTSVSIIAEPIKQCFYSASENIQGGAVFMMGFVPVFSSVTVAGGGISSSAVYSAMIFLASELSIQFADTVLIPMLSMCMAVSIVDAINPAISLTELVNSFKKLITGILGFIMMIFTGILSIQSIIGTSADNLSVKAGKYIASNFIPIVGGAVSDAYTTLRGSMGLLRGGIGSYGIITLVLMIMPSVVSAGLYYGAMKLALICSDMFGEKNLSKLFSNMSSVLAIVFSIMICFAVMMIISTTAVMITGMGMV